jgi:BirA family transcriptional regulator, biotin operon repressor / biotin---[acetyl-CoA-carboxylase] ligase
MASPPAEAAPDAALTRAFAACLPGHRLAGPLRAYRSLDSTQTVARAWALAGAPEGAVVLADYQTTGRGQRGRGWIAPPGAALLFSVVLRPSLPIARWPEIPLMAGCAIAEGMEAVGPLTAELKWPNDVVVEDRKVAGILAEGVASRPGLVLLGIGVNVAQRDADWPAALASRARSLAALGAPVRREPLLEALLGRLATWYAVLLEEGFEPVRAAWRRRGRLGDRVGLPDGEGTAVDLGPGGELLVRRDDGRLVSLVTPPEGRAERVVCEAP